MDQVLLYFALKYNGNWDEIYQALENQERISDLDLELVELKIDCHYLAITNPIYPESLKNSYKPPFVLFYQGDINLLINHYKTIGLVSDEQLSEYGFNETKRFVESLNNENKTWITLSEFNNLNLIWKHQILLTQQLVGLKEDLNHLVISESYEQNLTTDKQRLLFTMARFLFVPELNMRDPLFKTTKIVVGDDKQLFVIPHQNSEAKLANNWLIKQGAKLVENPFDILNEF